ncbi:hypothetical protein INT48_004580 [Thamnidium elegans]|uniref:Uncharacterized protein n=1 Tax=Thamnidium elegans TaxID=101142 RepID=A0A8H7SYR7_9FUNG|nr:hypothetical protein INT48_004580 [Thamnidium elegans]
MMPNTTDITGRNSPRAMGCRSFAYVKVCISQDYNKLRPAYQFSEVNNHFRNNLPKNKKYTSYEFCFNNSCGAMTTLTGSEFYPKNYEHVANLAVNELNRNKACYDPPKLELYPNAVDVYIYDFNFVFSWWFNNISGRSCLHDGGPYSLEAEEEE